MLCIKCNGNTLTCKCLVKCPCCYNILSESKFEDYPTNRKGLPPKKINVGARYFTCDHCFPPFTEHIILSNLQHYVFSETNQKWYDLNYINMRLENVM